MSVHRVILYFSIASIMFGCAHKQKPKEDKIEDEVYQGNISIEAVQNLALSSYLKACTQTSKLSFEACRKLAKKHASEIGEILRLPPKKK